MFGNYEIINQGFAETLLRFGLNLLVAFVVLRLIYYPRSKNIDHLFTFIIFNVVVFFITSLLSDVKIKTAVGFGLFAVFSVLRYRTEQIPIKEMTFLFLSITLAVLNAWNTGTKDDEVSRISIAEILSANFFIALITFILDRTLLGKIREPKELLSFIVSFNDVQKAKSPKESILSEMREQTGLNIHDFKIKRIDMEAQKTELIFYYYSSS